MARDGAGMTRAEFGTPITINIHNELIGHWGADGALNGFRHPIGEWGIDSRWCENIE